MPPKGERRKQQIIDTAKEMFMDNGYQSTHIGQVCEKLDIARGTVYQYFSNKKEIVFAILDNVIEQIEDIFDIDDLNEFFSTNPPVDSIIQFVVRRTNSCISVLINEPIVIKLLYKEIVGVDEAVNMHVNDSVTAIEKILSRDFEELKRRNIFRSTTDSAIMATIMIGGVLQVMYKYSRNGINILDSNVVLTITKNYLNGVLNQ